MDPLSWLICLCTRHFQVYFALHTIHNEREEVKLMTADMLRKALSDLEKRRRALGMSEAALAKRAGVSRSTVRRVLSGASTEVGLGCFVALAEALGVDIRFETEAPETYLER